MSTGKIFVCYRREDSAGHAGRLYDRLNQRFPGRVFMDVTGIGVGTRWAEVVEQTLGACEVAVILIGRRWLERSVDGNRRIDRAEDPLRTEIATALRHRLKVVPLLVGGAAVPERSDLPADVAPIADWQALRVDDDDFDHDATRLIRALEAQLGDQTADPHLDTPGARQDDIRRLMSAAQASMGVADWVTAAQTLRAVLSLDRKHAEAAARLREVEEQAAQTYRPAEATASAGARPASTRLVLGGAGAVAALVAWSMSPGGPFHDRSKGPTAPQQFEDTAPLERTDGLTGRANRPGGRGGRERPAVPSTEMGEVGASSLAGSWVLVSYSLRGTPVPLSGTMRLSSLGGERYQFETMVSNAQLGTTFQYRGLLQGRGSAWTVTTTESSDPTVISGAVPTQVTFEGQTVLMQNAFGQTAVWRKQ